jgi:glucose-6-phosphate isomerase
MTTTDLLTISGLPLELDPETGLLTDLDGSFHLEEPGRRRFGDLRSVVASPDAIDEIADEVAYLTYRDVRHAAETGLAANGLRYDITVTLPGAVSREHIKTAGHYHALDPQGVSWPEIYDVLSGSAVFVLQRAVGDPAGDPEIDRAVVVVAGPGDRLVIPPDYGHATVNVGDTPLVVADLVAVASNNHYQGYANRRGGAIRIMAVPNREQPFDAVWNPSFPEVSSGIEIVLGPELQSFEAETPLYTLGVDSPEKVAFLTNPSLSMFII